LFKGIRSLDVVLPAHWSVRAAIVAAWSLVVGIAIAVAPFQTDLVSAEVPRPAESAGTSPIGTASYAVPSGAIHVAPWGSDGASGSASAPLRTLTRALVVAPSSGTIVLRAGSYNEQVAVYKTLTIQNYPGEQVWLDGSTTVSGWVKDGTRWRHDGWTVRFDHSPTYTKGAQDSTNQYWQFVNTTTAPMAAHPDQLWIDGSRQKQVASLSAVTAGSFYLDESSSKLYVGSDPTGRTVAASNKAQAMNIRASGVVIRGIGIRRFAPSVWHVGAVTLENPNATLENVHISEMATTGLSVQSSGARLRQVTVSYSGMLGIHGRYADDLVLDKVLSRRNNIESFNITPVSGGAKLGTSRGIKVIDSNFSDNYGPGFWEDMSVYNTVVRGSNFNRNSGDGLFLEISARAVVGDSLFLNNKLDGIKVNNTSNVKIWNNTFTGNSRSVWLAQDYRRNTNQYDPAVDKRIPWPDPEMPWQLDDVTLSNNVLGLPGNSTNSVLCVEDYSGKETAEAMRIKVNGNVYNRMSSSSPTWLTIWSRGASNPAVFTTLAAFKSGTGQEARGREYTGSAVVSDTGALAESVQSLASSIAVGLPSDVAAAIGRPAGSTRLGAWSTSATSTPSPTPAPTPTPTPSPTPTSTPTVAPGPNPTTTGGVIAQDDFGRSVSGGWGNAEVGGNWTIPAAADRFAVAGGSGTIRLLAGDGFAARLDQVASTSSNVRIAMSVDQPPAGAGYFVNVIGRKVGSYGDYRAKFSIAANGTVSVWLVKTVGGTETVLSSAPTGLKYTVGETLVLRTQVSGTGSTTLRAKVWKINAVEPAAWSVSATDSTGGLQAPGSLGLYAYSGGTSNGAPVVAYVDGLIVRAG
jgi:hypothetical protein